MSRPKIGEYRHRPARAGPSAPAGARVRRRFPHIGLVAMGSGAIGTAIGAGVSLLLQATGNGRLLPSRISGLPLPPAPSLENVLFGAGPPEMFLACSLAGFLLWRWLWNTRLPAEALARGPRETLPALLLRGLILGPIAALLVQPIGAFGLFLRTGPADIPAAVKPFFGLLAAVVLPVAALMTGTVPLVLAVLGVGAGVATAVAVAWTWPLFPPEPSDK